MFDLIKNWIIHFWETLTLAKILIFGGVFLFTLALSFGAIAVMIVKLPENYFSSHYVRDFDPRQSWFKRWGAFIGKNALGVFFLLLGLALALPGVPGQGTLTILVGLILLDIPGKRPWEAKIIKRPAIQAFVNRYRARFGKPPFLLD